jgi:hypothetical protein
VQGQAGFTSEPLGQELRDRRTADVPGADE